MTRSATRSMPGSTSRAFSTWPSPPDFDRKTLSLNAFYAMQLLYVKAYGNWLGLMRLGSFVASQTGLRFDKLNCVTGIQKMNARADRSGRSTRPPDRPRPGQRRRSQRETNIGGSMSMKDSTRRRGKDPTLSLFRVGSEARPPSEAPPPGIAPLKPTAVYDTYWRFAAERQRVFFRRLERVPPPWTEDPILLGLQVHERLPGIRQGEPVSDPAGDLPGGPARTTRRRSFSASCCSRSSTGSRRGSYWRSRSGRSHTPITRSIGTTGPVRAMRRGARRSTRQRTSCRHAGSLGHDRKHRNHLALIERMMDGGAAGRRLADAGSMQKAFDLIRSYPSIGDFLAYQYITDINYSTVTNFTEMEFVIPGPGAIDGIRKCFADTAGLNDAEVIRFMAERQEIEFARLGLDFQRSGGGGCSSSTARTCSAR